MFRKLSQLRRFVLIMGLMMGLSIVGCTGAVPAKPSGQTGLASSSQEECTKLRKSVASLERQADSLRGSSGAASAQAEAELAAARQGIASCAAKGQ